MLLKIDQEFKNLIPSITHEERELLEKNIVREGCRDPIVVWNNTIIDGHNRYDICNKNGLEYKIHEIDLKDRNEAINWIIDNQLGRRNIPQQIRTYLIGKRYQNEKKTHGGDRKTEQIKEISSVQNELLIRTSEVIAKQNKISPDTVKRAESFAESIDKIAEISGKSATTILKETKVTQEEVKKVTSFAPEVQKKIVDKVMSGETKTFKEALKPIVEMEQQQTIDKTPDTDYCSYTPFIPSQSQIMTCPCGCGHGYCETNEKWYSPNQIKELKEE